MGAVVFMFASAVLLSGWLASGVAAVVADRHPGFRHGSSAHAG
jgi:anti-sigma factor RsiW